MSVFKDLGILLKKTTNKENNFILTLFSKNYGKINLNYKNNSKNKYIELGNILNFEINVKKENSINTIKNIKIQNIFYYENFEYSIIFEYLKLLNMIDKLILLNQENKVIFDIINEVILYQNITEEKIIYAQIKILIILGVFKIEIENISIKKIINFIYNQNIKTILNIKGLDQENINLLKKIIEQNIFDIIKN